MSRFLSPRRRRLLLIICVLVKIAKQNEILRKRRYYLTRVCLPPANESAWMHLFNSRNNKGFILTMGVGVHLFEDILQAGFHKGWISNPIPRNDVLPSRKPKNGNRLLDSSGALGLALHYLSSTMADYTLQQVFGLTPAVCSRYRSWALVLLLQTLRKMKKGRISWPSTREKCLPLSKLIEDRHPVLQNAIGFVDGCHFPVRAAGEYEEQNAFYNGWCSSHFTSNIFVFAPDGCIIDATINLPGSWHDSATARDLYRKLLTSTPDGFWIIGDTAFPSSGTLRERIKTPPKMDFNQWPNDPQECRRFIEFNEALVSARQAAEWGMRSLQGSFGRLKLPMVANDSALRGRIIESCCRLHNLRARVEGIGQIKTVYAPVWTGGGGEIGSFTGFENLRFREIRNNDRIRRYYNFIP